MAYQIQVAALGGPDKATLRVIRQPKGRTLDSAESGPFEAPIPSTREGADLRAGALLIREWKGKLERVTGLEKGFAWNGKSYASLSQIAKAMTGTAWNGHRFFGLRASTSARAAQARRGLVSEATARPDVASDTLKIAMVDAGRVPKPHLRLSRRLLPPTSDDRGLRRLIGDDRAATERDFAGRAVERDPVALADLPAVEGR